MNNKRIFELKEQLDDLLKRWPAHTVPAAMVQELGELEEAITMELEKNQSNAIEFQPIGYIENEFDQPTLPETIRNAESAIILSPNLAGGLVGLEAGQQVMVVFYFHKSQGFDLLQHPRGDLSRSQRGVFTLRSPRRPNPIGITTVDVLAVEENILRVRGLDALNGTPVLDLKPI